MGKDTTASVSSESVDMPRTDSQTGAPSSNWAKLQQVRHKLIQKIVRLMAEPSRPKSFGLKERMEDEERERGRSYYWLEWERSGPVFFKEPVYWCCGLCEGS